MLKVVLESRVERTQVTEWFSKFRSSVTFAEDRKCLICPLTSKTNENMCLMNENVLKNKRIITCEFATK